MSISASATSEAVGVKTTEIVQDALGAMDVAQVLVCVKSLADAPTNENVPNV
jgi:hypothetical protein